MTKGMVGFVQITIMSVGMRVWSSMEQSSRSLRASGSVHKIKCVTENDIKRENKKYLRALAKFISRTYTSWILSGYFLREKSSREMTSSRN